MSTRDARRRRIERELAMLRLRVGVLGKLLSALTVSHGDVLGAAVTAGQALSDLGRVGKARKRRTR
jgi:hypothetical protein